jgi:hypothetical protein
METEEEKLKKMWDRIWDKMIINSIYGIPPRYLGRHEKTEETKVLQDKLENLIK